MLGCSGSSACDNRNRGDLAYRAQHLQVEAASRAVGVHRVDDDFAGAQPLPLLYPLQQVQAGVAPPAMTGDLETTGRVRGAPAVDREHHALRPEPACRAPNQGRISDRSRVDRYLVGTGPQQPVEVFDLADPTADRKRNEDLVAGVLDEVDHATPGLGTCGDVVEHELVDELRVVLSRQLERVAHVYVALELDALRDFTVVNVEAGHDSHCYGHHRSNSYRQPSSGTPYRCCLPVRLAGAVRRTGGGAGLVAGCSRHREGPVRSARRQLLAAVRLLWRPVWLLAAVRLWRPVWLLAAVGLLGAVRLLADVRRCGRRLAFLVPLEERHDRADDQQQRQQQDLGADDDVPAEEQHVSGPDGHTEADDRAEDAPAGAVAR